MTATISAPRRAITPAFIAINATATILLTVGAMLVSSMLVGGDRSASSQPPLAVIIHVSTVIPALFLGMVVMLMRKGTARHKMLGRIWASLMVVTAISSFWLQGLFGGIGPIHVFSVMTLISMPRAIWAIRKGDVKTHERAMTGPFIGLIIAGLFSFVPGRMMGDLLFSLI